MSILIRYEGFVIEATNRFYNFSVNGTSEEPRQFTVGIRSESFIPLQLKFQDGPAISFHRLKEEIDHESLECPAKAQMIISGQDIEEYLVTQHPKKVQKKRRQTSAPAADELGEISYATTSLPVAHTVNAFSGKNPIVGFRPVLVRNKPT